MKKTVIILSVVVVLQAVLNIYCIFFMSDVKYSDNEKWFVENSPYLDNYCKITAFQAEPGSPLALNGSTKVTISVYSQNKELACFEDYIKNKGKPLDETNYSVEWHEKYVLLKLYDYDKQYHSYRFYYDD
ncbi:MAG: hypothetical protein IJK31_11175 [Ruminococcus sp.]|nr:hypothetical protein [Ruminococcus sp.]HRR77369.1 hypothetical protein [Ruminococcus sp.]